MAKLTPMDTQHRIERDWETAAQIQASRDALLAALRALVNYYAPSAGNFPATLPLWDAARAAIAEAERG